MTGKKNAVWIGAFVVGALGLAIASLVFFGSGRFFRDRLDYVLFFEGSVKGLNVGSPVTFRGVRVGEVTEISVHVEEVGEELVIPVQIEMEAETFQDSRPDVSLKDRRRMIDDLVARGLRAQLVLQSIVTGQLLVNLELYPEDPVRLHGTIGDFEIPELPTIPSPTEELRQTAKDVIRWVQDLPLDEIFEELHKTVASVGALAEESRQLIGSEELRKSLAGLDGTLQELQVLAGRAGDLIDGIDREIGPLAENLGQTLDEARSTLAAATSAMESVGGAVEEGSPLRYQLSETLLEVQAAARSMRVLTDSLEQRPESIVFGKEDSP